MKHLGSLIGKIILLMTCWGPSAFAQTESYVAIGDSLAAGQTPFQQIDVGSIKILYKGTSFSRFYNS